MHPLTPCHRCLKRPSRAVLRVLLHFQSCLRESPRYLRFSPTTINPRSRLLLCFKPCPRAPVPYPCLPCVSLIVHPRLLPPLYFLLAPRVPSPGPPLAFLVVLVWLVPLHVIQHTSTLLVQYTPTLHKPWVPLAQLVTALCSAMLALVLKPHLHSLRTHVTFYPRFIQRVNVFLRPLLPQWRK